MIDPDRRNLLRLMGLSSSALMVGSSCQSEAAGDARETARHGLSIADFGARSDGSSDDRGAWLSGLRRLPNGGVLSAPVGSSFISDTIELTGQRVRLSGQGPNVSTIVFSPPRPSSAVRLHAPGKGGMFQAGVDGFGFLSTNDVPKTAIELVNVSSCIVERIGIAMEAWPGAGSIGIRTRGRDTTSISRCVLACARPLVHSRNPVHPTLAVDHLRISECELISTDPNSACIDFEDGVCLGNTSIEKTALVGGLDGVRWVDRSSTHAGFNLSFSDVRTEQAMRPGGWSFDLRSTRQHLQSVLFQNCRLDSERNGIRLRNAQRITLINVDIDTNQARPTTLLDIEGIPGTVLTMIGCFAQVGGNVRLSRLRRVQGVPSYFANTAFGPNEVWVYDG
jgi:hypothetical protein